MGASWTPWSSWRPLGALLEASWEPPRGLLGRKKVLLIGPFRLLGKFQDRFQPKKTSWSALGRSKKNFKTGFNHLGGQKAPKGSTGGSKIELGRRLELEMANPQKLTNVLQNSLNFEVPGSLWGSKSIQNCFRFHLRFVLAAGRLFFASWSAL